MSKRAWPDDSNENGSAMDDSKRVITSDSCDKKKLGMHVNDGMHNHISYDVKCLVKQKHIVCNSPPSDIPQKSTPKTLNDTKPANYTTSISS